MAPQPTDHKEAITKRKSVPFVAVVPLLYAPILPLIRINLRHKPILRDRLFIGVLAAAFVHGVYLVSEMHGEKR